MYRREGYTIKPWIRSTDTTKKKYSARLPITLKPWIENNEVIKQKTPIGAKLIRIKTIFIMTLVILSIISKSLLFSFLISLKAIPKNIEKTIIWSIWPSAIAWIGFVGKIFIITDFKSGASGALNWVIVARSKPDPGEKIIATNKPTEIANAVVNKYRDIVLNAIKDNFLSLSNEATPVDREKKTSGTTINFKEAIKIDPIISKIPSIKYVFTK